MVAGAAVVPSHQEHQAEVVAIVAVVVVLREGESHLSGDDTRLEAVGVDIPGQVIEGAAAVVETSA